MKRKSGFTILELAVTVIIIAVIAVVALPMYKHAVLKSRFSTVMPMAKAVADAQEIYYLGNNQYALGKEDLDIAPVEAENTQVSLSPAEEDEEYIYVAAHRTDIPNVRYIMYQKNSPKFAGNIHCEADANDEDALWLCEKALHGTKIEKGSITPGYTTYILTGSLSDGTFGKPCEEEQETEDTNCACGKRTRSVTGCNDDIGEWVYGEWSECPVKPSEEENCDNGVSGKMTRTSQCQEGSWTEPEWDKHLCCKPEENPITTRSCKDNYSADTCGLQTQKYACGTDGEWHALDEWDSSGCTTAPQSTTEACDSPYTHGNKTSSYSCVEDEWQESWDTTACGYNCTGTAPTQQLTCPLGCGKYTGTASCNYETGLWDTEYIGDDSSCPTKPADYTDRCDSGQNGSRTYTYVCNSSGTGWTSQVKSSTCTTVSAGGTFSDQNGCSAATNGTCAGGYTFTNRAWCYAYMGEGRCDNNNFSEHSYCYSGTSASCRNGTYTEGSWCMTGTVVTSTGLCQGGTYSTSSYCQGNYGTGACSGATYQTNSYCVGGNETSCTGNTFKTGTYCYAKKAGACANNTYEGTACCYATSTGLCPSGSRKCNSSHVWDNTYW